MTGIAETVVAQPSRYRSLSRYRAFAGAVFPLRVHLTYAVLWTLAYEAGAALTVGGTWRPTPATALRAASVVAVLLYLRLVDEQMDESYDRVHHPDRPLITGLVTVTELRRGARRMAGAVIAVNAVIAPWSALVLAGLAGYAGLLLRLTRRYPAVPGRPLLYLAVAYPVQLAIGGYLYTSAVGTGSIPPGARPALLTLVFAAAFLHFEFARKTFRDAPAGVRAYSATALGVTGSGLLTLGWALLAGALLATLTRPWQYGPAAWLPYPALVLPAVTAVRHLGGRSGSGGTAPALLFVFTLYAAIAVGGRFAGWTSA